MMGYETVADDHTILRPSSRTIQATGVSGAVQLIALHRKPNLDGNAPQLTAHM